MTVSAEEPRVQLDVELVWIEPPTPIDLTDYWDLSLRFDDGTTEDSGLFYIEQTGTQLYASPGDTEVEFNGFIDGSAVTLIGDVGAFYGTVSVDGKSITGSFESIFGNGEFTLVLSTFPFGPIVMNGTCAGVGIDLDTTYGRGFRTIEHSESVRFDVLVGSFNPAMAGLDINGDALSEGTFTVTDWHEDGEEEEEEEEPQNPVLHASLWMPEHTYDASGGTVVIDVYSGTHMEGTFNLDFPDGNHLSGWFNVNFDSSGQSYLEGQWQGDSFIPGNSISSYSHFFSGTWSGLVLNYWGPELNVDVWFTFPGLVTAGTYTMSVTNDEFWGHLEWSPAVGQQLEEVEMTASSTLILGRCDDNGMAGSFVLSFVAGGTVSGNFDVSFTEEGM